MGQPDKRVWDSEQERLRKQAQRERARGVKARDERLEAYVAYEVAVTQGQIAAGLLRDLDGRTVARSEAYARWRFMELGTTA